MREISTIPDADRRELRLSFYATRILLMGRNSDFPSAMTIVAMTGWHPSRFPTCQPVPIREERQP